MDLNTVLFSIVLLILGGFVGLFVNLQTPRVQRWLEKYSVQRWLEKRALSTAGKKLRQLESEIALLKALQSDHQLIAWTGRKIIDSLALLAVVAGMGLIVFGGVTPWSAFAGDLGPPAIALVLGIYVGRLLRISDVLVRVQNSEKFFEDAEKRLAELRAKAGVAEPAATSESLPKA